MTLQDMFRGQGASLAADGIPLHFGNPMREYQTALNQVVLLDRSHEGRLRIDGADRFDFLNRMSTNELLNLGDGAGRATIFTNPHGRVIDRAEVFNQGESLLCLTEPGRGAALQQFLQRHIFFNDKVKLTELMSTTRQFALHGPNADAVMDTLVPELSDVEQLHGRTIRIDDVAVFAARRIPLVESHWMLVVPNEAALQVWQALLEVGQSSGIVPAGSLLFNVLRIRAGRPAAGRELTTDYIPLELGLWDEVSFTKGCYTGQEIIARMESRGQLAKTLVSLHLDEAVDTPAILHHKGRQVGNMTSCATAPDGTIFALGVVKVQVVEDNLAITIGENETPVRLGVPMGVQPFTTNT